NSTIWTSLQNHKLRGVSAAATTPATYNRIVWKRPASASDAGLPQKNILPEPPPRPPAGARVAVERHRHELRRPDHAAFIRRLHLRGHRILRSADVGRRAQACTA